MLFNRDIKRFFAKIDLESTDDFRVSLKHRVLGKAASHEVKPMYSRRSLSRLLALSIVAILFVVIGTKQYLAPQSSMTALAQAIENTFTFSDTGYHHQKSTFFIAGDDTAPGMSSVTEYWQDDTHAIIESAQTVAGEEYATSLFIDSESNLSCSYTSDADTPTCSTPTFDFNEKFINADSLKISNITIEPANDTHGDLYLTWTTDHPLKNPMLSLSEAGSYGYVSSGGSTYNWVNDKGEFINRATLVKSNIFQNPLAKKATTFLVQIEEFGPEIDPIEHWGERLPALSTSPVYNVDVNNWSVEKVSDSWLEESRIRYGQDYMDFMTSGALIKQDYEWNLAFVDYITRPENNSHFLKSERIMINGSPVDVQTYALSPDAPYMVNNVMATRTEFAININARMVLWFTLFDANSRVIQHTEILISEERPTTPPGTFDLEAWKTRVQK